MFNLIKNELFKIFRRKTIWFIFIFTAILFITEAIAASSSIADPLRYNELCLDEECAYFDSYGIGIYNDNIEEYESNAENKDIITDPEKNQDYLHAKTVTQEYLLLQDYNPDSFEYYYILENISPSLKCMISSKIYGDTEEYNKCQSEYNDVIYKATHTDYKDYLKNKKENLEKQINELKGTEEATLLGFELEGVEYCINNDIMPSNVSYSYKFANNYVTNAQAFYSMNQNKDSYEKSEIKEIRREYYFYKYVLDNKLQDNYSNSYQDVDWLMVEWNTIFTIFLIIYVGGTIIADEFSKGTIKQLLIRPYNRGTILMSKILAFAITLLSFFIFTSVIEVMIYGVINNFNVFTNHFIAVDINSNKIYDMNFIEDYLLYSIGELPMYIIFFLISIFTGIVTANSSFATAVPIVLYLGSNLIYMFNLIEEIFSYLPSFCWNLNDYFFGGYNAYNGYCTLTRSIIVDVVIILGLFILSLIFFKKKEITNV